MRARNYLFSFLVAVFVATAGITLAHAAPFMIVGMDEKVLWDDQFNLVFSPPGKDAVLIVDLANLEDPKIIANLPLKNSVFGPPTNVAIDPTNSVALVPTRSTSSRMAKS